MRTMRRCVVAVLIGGLAGVAVATRGQETITITENAASAECGCRDRNAPPWHGNVRGPARGPVCHHCGVFHANPCGQLCMKHQMHAHGFILPPAFPRLHTLLTEGYMPTPRPITLPRCHQCGALIEGGF